MSSARDADSAGVQMDAAKLSLAMKDLQEAKILRGCVLRS